MDIRISEVTMQRSDDQQKAKAAQRKTRSSTTLNRRYVKQPSRKTDTYGVVARSSQIQHFRTEQTSTGTQSSTVQASNVIQSRGTTKTSNAVPVRVAESKQQTRTVQRHPLQTLATERMQLQQAVTGGQKERKMTAKEIKDQAIRRALIDASATEQVETTKKSKKKMGKMHFGFGRVMLALSCAAAAVLAIVYFVNLNMPDLSLKVAAMQTGINASYPGRVPRGYSVSSITSESKKIILDFKGSSEEEVFTLTEEASSWDSNALLNNYVKETFKDDFKTVKEQGLTIYISGSNAAWVNGGVVYKITAGNGVLTNKQICSIATSL